MDPLQASWLVKACCVLHNRCLDWGLRKLKPGENRDPTMEADILVQAAERFRDANEGVGEDDAQDAAAAAANPRQLWPYTWWCSETPDLHPQELWGATTTNWGER